MTILKVHIGQRFGRLTVLSFRQGRSNDRGYLIRVRCDCGVEQERQQWHVTSGKVKSCGCRQGTRHGLVFLPEYSIWHGMLQRCYNAKNNNYHNYGGRGIAVCKRWRDSVETFIADMGPRPTNQHSIERVNNDGDYEPSNCKWATRTEQLNNTRLSHRLTIEGETLTIAQWAKRTGNKHFRITTRLSQGWAAKDAVFTPVVRPGRDGITGRFVKAAL